MTTFLSAPVSWEDFRASMLQAGVPATLSLGGRPPVLLFVTRDAERIGIRVAVEAGAPSPLPCPIQQLSVRTVQDGTQRSLELSTASSPLFREFFYLALSATDLILREKVPPAVAVDRAIGAWRSLLRSAMRLSDENVLGLMGELWTLHRLIRTRGPSQVETWTASKGEPHDFRLSHQEVEVKVTRRTQRVHLISGASQMVPSEGFQLFLLSLQMEPAGGGNGGSLPDYVTRVRDALFQAPAELDRFHQMLESRSSYRQADADLYPERFRLRTRPALVPVNGACPQLTPALIDSAVGSALAARIGHLVYEVNVEGLGDEDGTAPFLDVLPAEEVQ